MFAVFVLVCSSASGVSAVNPVQAGKSLLGKPPRIHPHPVARPFATTLEAVSRRSLVGVDDVQGNINALLQHAVDERRIGEIQKLSLQQQYSLIPERGDLALLECLKVQSCDLTRFPDLAAEVGQNQLHLQHAARCIGCNKINVFKLSGNTVEGLMDSFYERGGWKKLEGEIGNSGIDGLYYKVSPTGEVVDVLVTEAKYNESILQETRSGTQMSKQWILDNLARLDSQATLDNHLEDASRYRAVSHLVVQDKYRAQIWHMNVDDDRLLIWRERISSKGRQIDQKDLIVDEPPWNPGDVHEIDMLNPASDFDRLIVNDYTSIMSRSGAAMN